MGERAQNTDSGVTIEPSGGNLNDNANNFINDRNSENNKLPELFASVNDTGNVKFRQAGHGIPNFVQETLSKKIHKNPELLAFIKPKGKGKRKQDGMASVVSHQKVVPKLGKSPQRDGSGLEGTESGEDNINNNSPGPGVPQTSVSDPENEDVHMQPSKVSLITRSSTLNPGDLDKDTFTFKPKMSAVSAKIVGQLGSDFMSRQQKHLEKQKKLVSIIIKRFCMVSNYIRLMASSHMFYTT